MTIRAGVVQQPGPYMWVQLAESPLGLGSLYVRILFQCKEKVEFSENVGGKLGSSILESERFQIEEITEEPAGPKKRVKQFPVQLTLGHENAY